ncbi:host specificity factor TipJ family phage tail protein, partial [Raoultella planticola]|uniref:host specificity factor TipJ family phage tail protein n=1 Tax=Raoultella planticola TaxID=575 RepID=UPI002F2C07FE
EKYTLDGVLDPNRAYRIGMRRLMKYLHQRLGHTTSTELDALVYQFGDRILLTDDIPGNKTVSSLVVDMSTDGGQTTFSVTEPLDWSFDNPRAIVRYQDGSASGLLVVTQVGDYELSVPWQASFDDIVLEDPYIEPPRLIFCNSTRSYYDAIFDEIGSPSDGTCSITARQYSEIFYQYDDAIYPGNVA